MERKQITTEILSLRALYKMIRGVLLNIVIVEAKKAIGT
jgi:hypothetical protein